MTALHLISLLCQPLPLALTGPFAGLGAVLQLGVLMRAVVEQLWIDLHKQLHGVVYHTVYSSKMGSARAMLKQHSKFVPIPMAFRVLVKWREHNWQYSLHIVANQVAEVFVVPEVECSLRHLGAAISGASVMLVCNFVPENED